MNKNDYLKLSLSLKLYAKKAWIISAFSVTKEKQTAAYHGQLLVKPWGYSYFNENLEEVKIDDAIPSEPLFRFQDRIQVDSTWAGNIREPVETSIGNLLFNAVCILSSFGVKHPYTLGRISVSSLEDNIAKKLQDTPASEDKRSTEYFYVDEYVKFVDSLQFLSTLSQLCTWSATRKVITAPPGIKEFKDSLIKKYGETLTDPVILAKFEKELLEFDAQYLKGDPADTTFVSGKIRNTSRKKMFLAMGAELQFSASQKVTPVTNSLEQGWPTDPVNFTAAMNGLRVGSFSRGAETVKGGVSAKYLLRAANNFKIVDTDCGSELGMRRNYTKDNIAQLEGRYVILGGGPKLVENIEQAQNYLNQRVTVRSPMYCKLEGDNICKICAGKRLSQFPTGLTIPLTEISGIILTASLKLMHTNTTATAKLKLNEAFS